MAAPARRGGLYLLLKREFTAAMGKGAVLPSLPWLSVLKENSRPPMGKGAVLPSLPWSPVFFLSFFARDWRALAPTQIHTKREFERTLRDSEFVFAKTLGDRRAKPAGAS